VRETRPVLCKVTGKRAQSCGIVRKDCRIGSCPLQG